MFKHIFYLLSSFLFSLQVVAYEIVTEPVKIFQNDEGVNSVAFSPDGQYVLSGSDDNTIKLWDVNTGEVIRSFEGHTDDVESAVFSPDGQYVLSGSDDNTIKLWDVNTGELIHFFEGYTNSVNSVAFSPDGHYVLSGNPDWDDTMKLWDVNTGELIRSFEGHTNSVWSVAFSPDGHYVLSGNGDSTMKLWDVNTGELIRSFEGHVNNVKSVAFSPDGYYVLSGNGDGTMKLLDVNTGKLIRSFEGHTYYAVWSVAFSPDGQYVLSGDGDSTMKLWDVNTGELIRSFEGHTNGLNSVAFSPNGQYALSGSSDNTMKLWWTKPNEAPVANFSLSIGSLNINTEGLPTGYDVMLGASSSSDTDGSIATYKWFSTENHSQVSNTPDITLPFTTYGTHQITLVVVDDEGLESEAFTQSFTIETPEIIKPIEVIENQPSTNSLGTAIIIAASGAHPENTLFSFSHRFTQEIYRLLIARGFTDETVEYLSPMYPDIDANGFPDDGTKDPKRQDYNLFAADQDLKQAFAKAAANLQVGQQFIFYIHGHARKDNLLLSRDYELTATQLKDYLATIPAGVQQIIILDACYSGSFLDDLAGVENRIVVTSADDANQAWNTEYTSFTDKFIVTLRRGQTLKDAFIVAEDTIIGEPSLFGDQRPWLDDDQDGVYSTRDGSRAAQVYLGKEGIAAAPPPEITQVHGRIELPEHETTTTLWVKVALNPDAIRRVTAVLMPPELSVKTYEGENTFFGKQEVELIYNLAQNRYEANYTEFRSAGTWRIFYQAQDMQGVSSDIKKGEVDAKGTTLPITVKMVLNQKRYTADDPLLLDMVLTGTANVDLYVAIVYPSGGFQTISYPFVLSMQNAIQPYQTNVTHSGQKSFSIMNFPLPNGIPKGQYSTCGVLVSAGNRQPEDVANWIHYDCPSFEIY